MIICLFCSDSSDGETAIKHKTFRMADLQMLYFRNLGTAYRGARLVQIGNNTTSCARCKSI